MAIPEHLAETLAQLPLEPGVYVMRDRRERPVYIGKAKVLRQRVAQYFNGHDSRAFVAQIDTVVATIDSIVTHSEREALLLEATLIRLHKPRFNVQLRDANRFLLLRLDTAHDFPRIELVRRRKKDGARYFGPYESAGDLRKTLKVLERHFRLRSCSDSEFKRRDRVCLDYEIGRCSGPCVLPVPAAEYGRDVEEVVWFLRGRGKPLIAALSTRMEEAARKLQFERGARLRDEINLIKRSLEKQSVILGDGQDLDVVALIRKGDLAAAVVLPVRGGCVLGKHASVWRDMVLPEADLLRGFLLAYYGEEGASSELPPRLNLSTSLGADRDEIVAWLSERAGRKVIAIRPQRGTHRRLVEMALHNAEEELARALVGISERGRALERLRLALHLDGPPMVIDAIDISTFQGRDTVGGKVRFSDGKKDTSGYRSVHLRGAAEGDDFTALRQLILRFYGKHPEELPDLLVVDGGRAQLGAVVRAFAAAGLRMPAVCGLAKARRLADGRGFDGAKPEDEGRRVSPERVFVPGRKNYLSMHEGDAGLALLVRARDEVHRFAITRHRNLRNRRNKRSALEDIPGVGPAKRRALLLQFGSLKRVGEATLEELRCVSGISESLAEAIRRALT
jgi:excinuclease ABC subunit C